VISYSLLRYDIYEKISLIMQIYENVMEICMKFFDKAKKP